MMALLFSNDLFSLEKYINNLSSTGKYPHNNQIMELEGERLEENDCADM
jgi:hypothetical protein